MAIKVFDYDNYRSFLRDSFEALKKSNSKFTYGDFSKIAGFKSRATLKLIIDGQRNISRETAEKLIGGFKLTREEARFFLNLVELNQAKGLVERQQAAEKILKHKGFAKHRPITEAQYRYYTNWYYVVIREMVDLNDFQESASWISRRLLPHVVTPAEVERAIEVLLKLGLLVRDADERLRQAEQIVRTSDEIAAPFLIDFHSEMIAMAARSILSIPRETREISAVTIGICSQDVAKLKGVIQQFRDQICEMTSNQKNLDSVYQVNFQFFPIVTAENKKS